ncbi:MAG: GNAT family N-acetyltransferase [Sandaracinaceae bacterium]|nr:GNAT family N-acetyltransferase [Sandaracinaceae bacterium]
MPTQVLAHRLALPDDPDLDQFSSGNPEVDRYFVNRAFGKGKLTTYQFFLPDGSKVGYAAVAIRKTPDPTDASTTKAKYLVVYAFGLHQRFQGSRNAAGDTLAVQAFRLLEEEARNAGCAGLSLWVRQDNPRAIGFYKKNGMTADPGGAVQRDQAAPHLTMRKPV